MLIDFNEKLNAKQELITNLESQQLAQSTTDATSSQEQSESSTEDLIISTTIQSIQSIENVSETNDITGDNLMVAEEDVNIRKMPSPNSPILGVLLKDSTINVKDTVQGWYKIITKEGKEGYIYSPMLKEKN
jgi:uncharacterized protein YgiM (DUF1202 family)